MRMTEFNVVRKCPIIINHFLNQCCINPKKVRVGLYLKKICKTVAFESSKK